jgi:hypothetical protein
MMKSLSPMRKEKNMHDALAANVSNSCTTTLSDHATKSFGIKREKPYTGYSRALQTSRILLICVSNRTTVPLDCGEVISWCR